MAEGRFSTAIVGIMITGLIVVVFSLFYVSGASQYGAQINDSRMIALNETFDKMDNLANATETAKNHMQQVGQPKGVLDFVDGIFGGIWSTGNVFYLVGDLLFSMGRGAIDLLDIGELKKYFIAVIGTISMAIIVFIFVKWAVKVNT